MGSLGRAVYTLGSLIRGSGQALDRFGTRLQGSYYLQETLSRHRTLMDIFDKSPIVDKDAFVAPGASIIGNVLVGKNSSIWYGCVLRGDVNSIHVGSGTNIQDNSLILVEESELCGKGLPTIIGDNVTIGHSAVIHACTVDDEAFVGMGAILLDDVHVEKHAMVAAGALVKQGTKVPSGEVCSRYSSISQVHKTLFCNTCSMEFNRLILWQKLIHTFTALTNYCFFEWLEFGKKYAIS
nr:Gamma carbonic anhydrase 1, mitochondrial [Ipomoea batatas]